MPEGIDLDAILGNPNLPLLSEVLPRREVIVGARH
jgi:hypothetical protein